MAKLNVTRTPVGENELIHYTSKELRKKLKLDTPDIYVLADKNNSWISAGYTPDANEVGNDDHWLQEIETCNHYNPERFHRASSIQCVSFLLRTSKLGMQIVTEIFQDDWREHLNHCGPCHDAQTTVQCGSAKGCIEGREIFAKL